MSEKLITIATFNQVIEAHLSKSRLESDGIECFIADEYIVAVNWLYSNAVGGVKLQVKENDVERSIEILRQEPFKLNNVVYCPKCNSSDVYYEKFSRCLLFASWLFLGIPFTFLKRKWKCMKCGYEFKVK